jgi:thymidine phosphorylase
VRTFESSEKLKYYFKVIGANMNMKIKVLITDGSQPVGRGIGPALEAMDVLSVLRNETHAPQDLKIRSLEIAAEVLELAEIVELGKGFKLAEKLLSSGEAYSKFESICKAQGAFKVPEYAPNKLGIEADKSGIVVEIDNRKLAKLAKLAGAPKELSAGVLMQCHLNKKVKKGEILFYIYSAELGELNYALDYLKSQINIVRIE